MNSTTGDSHFELLIMGELHKLRHDISNKPDYYSLTVFLPSLAYRSWHCEQTVNICDQVGYMGQTFNLRWNFRTLNL